MSTQLMKITSEAEWLEKRKNYVTSTQIPCLFGLEMDYAPTAFELFHITRGNLADAFKENKFMIFGKLVEPTICKMINVEHPSWIIEEYPFFAYDDEDKIGSSFDRFVRIDGKKYLLELKSISYGEYKKKFTEHSEDDIEAPTAYEVQMQTELEMVKDQDFAGLLMAVFIADTRELKYIFRTHDAPMCNAIRIAVKDFNALTSAPEPDYAKDKSIIAHVAPAADANNEMDATENKRITELAAIIRSSKDLITQEEKVAEAAQAELMMLIGTAKKVWTNTHKISIADIKPNVGTQITTEMVGTFYGAKKGYKRMTISATGEA